jgi:hypothetical protein
MAAVCRGGVDRCKARVPVAIRTYAGGFGGVAKALGTLVSATLGG